MGTGDTVRVFDGRYWTETTPPPPPAFDGPGGLPVGWSRTEVSVNGVRVRGAMPDYAAAVPREGGTWGICPVRGGVLKDVWLDDMVAAIVMAEFTWPRK